MGPWYGIGNKYRIFPWLKHGLENHYFTPLIIKAKLNSNSENIEKLIMQISEPGTHQLHIKNC